MALKLRFIFTEEELKRVKFEDDGSITINVHGLSKKGMQRVLQNISALVLPGQNMIIKVIHGFNHGTTLKDCIEKGEAINRKYTWSRAYESNPGVSVIEIAA